MAAAAALWTSAAGAATSSDLVLTSVKTNKVSLVGRPFYVLASVADRALTPRKALVTVSSGATTLAATSAVVRPGRRVTVKLPITLTTPGRTRLTVALGPGNARAVTVDAAEFRV